MRFDPIIAEMVWSYSRLSSFENCPYQWVQRYIYREEAIPKFFAEYGTMMHRLLQRYFSGELTKSQLSMEYVVRFASDIESEAPNSKIQRSYFEQGYQYFKSFSFPERKVLAVEQEFHFPFAGHDFIAYVDLQSCDNTGALYVTDHKSRTLSGRSGRAKPTKSDRELDDYLRQLYIYAAAIHHERGVWPDFLEFNCFRSNEIIREPFRMDRMEETEAWAAHTIETITKTDEWYPILNYWFCKYICGVSEPCEYIELL